MELLTQGARFGSVGAINTIVGLAVIYAVMWLGSSPTLANAIGYAVGLACSFLLHRTWTFDSQGPAMRQLPKYLFIAGGSYLLNLAAVIALTQHVGFNPYASQLIGMALYTFATFFGIRWAVFGSRRLEKGSDTVATARLDHS